MNRTRSSRWLLVPLAIWAVWYAFFFVARPFGDLEEAVNGNLAVALNHGISISPWYFQYRPWAHGSFVAGLLLTPVYALFGSSIVWIKALGMLFAVGGTLVWTLLVRRAWGVGVALAFAIWWTLPPPYLDKMLHVVWMNHMESIALIGLIFWLFLRIDAGPPTRRAAFAIGGVAGLASFFCYQNLGAAAAVALCAVWRWRRAGLVRLLAFGLPGFALGFSPHLAYILAVGVHTSPPAANQPVRVLARDLVLVILPRAGGFDYAWASALFFLLAAAAAAWAAARSFGTRTRPAAPGRDDLWLTRLLVLYLAVYFAAYLLGGISIVEPGNEWWYRYLLPLFPVAMALVCRMLAASRRPAAWLVLAPLLIASVPAAHRANVVTQFREAVGAGNVGADLLRQRGDDFYLFATQGLSFYLDAEEDRRGVTPETIAAAVRSVPGPWKPTAWETAGAWLGRRDSVGAILDAVADPASPLSPGAPSVASGLGRALIDRYAWPNAADGSDEAEIRDTLVRIGALDPATAEPFAVGIGFRLTRGFWAGHMPAFAFSYAAGEADWSAAPHPDPVFREEIDRTREVALVFAGALSARGRIEAARGAGRFVASGYSGYRDFVGDPRAVLVALLGSPGTPGEIAAYRVGETEGLALRLLADRNWIDGREVAALPDRLPVLAGFLAERGVTVRPDPERPGRYRLAFEE